MSSPQDKSPLGPVLIIGGCGFLGSRIVLSLLDLPDTPISVFDISTTHNRHSGVNYHSGDICSHSTLASVLEASKPRIIFHTASPPALMHNGMPLFQRVNVDGTRVLLDAARASGHVQAFVYTSSASVIHDGVSDLIDADESLPLVKKPRQISDYTHTKAVAEEMVLAWNSSKMLTCALRPAAIFGEGDRVTVGAMVENAKAGKTRFQVGNGENRFDFTYVGNLVDAHVLAARALVKEFGKGEEGERKVGGEAFNITNDERPLFWEFARKVGAAGGYAVTKDEVRVIPVWLGLVMAYLNEFFTWLFSGGKKRASMTVLGIRNSSLNRTYRIEKARERIGYRPRVSLEEGIERSGRWWRESMEEGAEGKKSS